MAAKRKYGFYVHDDDDDDDDDLIEFEIPRHHGNSKGKVVTYDVKAKEIWVSGEIRDNFGKEFINAVKAIEASSSGLTIDNEALEKLVSASVKALEDTGTESVLNVKFNIDAFKQSDSTDPIEITVYLNSPGGNSMEAFPAFDYMMGTKHKFKYKTIATGKCMSAATLLLLGGDTRVAYPNCEFMVHAPYVASVGGPSDDLKDLARSLARTEKSFRDTYSTKTNLSSRQAKSIMNKDTYFNSETALKWGFIDSIGVS